MPAKIVLVQGACCVTVPRGTPGRLDAVGVHLVDLELPAAQPPGPVREVPAEGVAMCSDATAA